MPLSVHPHLQNKPRLRNLWVIETFEWPPEVTARAAGESDAR